MLNVLLRREYLRFVWARPSLRLAMLALLFAASACTTTPEEEDAADDSSSAELKVAIVVSQRAPVFDDVAEQLQRVLGKRAVRYYLTGKSAADSELARTLMASDRQQVVAIGLPAALWSKQLQNRQIVFCQVFNYRQYKLVSDSRKGVSSVPPADQLFGKWKALSPSLRRVVTITGPYHKHLVAAAKAAAAKQGIGLDHIVVRSDKEFRYTFKNRVVNYQGVWLLPDNRILSRSAMHEVMSYSVRNGKQVAVFNPQLLAIGGLISAEPKPEDVANQVIRRLRQANAKTGIPGPDVTALGQTRFQINTVLARQLGLKSVNTNAGNGV